MQRRDFLKKASLGAAAGATATLAAPAIAQSLPTIKWRLTSSFPKSLDTVFGGAETMADRVRALTGGKFWGADWLDPVMGLVGAGLVGIWAFGLLRDTGRVLLDAEMDAPVVAEIVEVIEQGPVAAEIVDFHVWRVGRGKYACILSLLVEEQVEPERFKEQLSVHEELVHVTVEVNQRPHLEAGP